MYSEISVSRLKNIINDIKLIDIRDECLFNKGHIPNSINIPIYKLLSDPSFYLDEKENYYLYCAVGCSSEYAGKTLAKKGYNVFNIKGGYRQWLMEK